MRLVTTILFLISSWSLLSQCPEDPKVSIINTQEKYDYFMENYPNCDDYSIRKYDNKFIGDPKNTQYIWSLLFSLIGILAILKAIFRIRKM